MIPTAQQIEAFYKMTPGSFAVLPVVERAILRLAYSCDVLHVHEDGPPHVNRGSYVDRYNTDARAALGSPWCAACWFTQLMDSGAARHELPQNPASVHSWREWSIASGGYSKTPKRGDAGLLIFTPTEGHLTVITAVDLTGGTCQTLEGNTNTDGSRDGWEIARKTRKIGHYDGFADMGGIS